MTLMEIVLNLIFPENLYCSCCGDLINGSRVHGLCDACIRKIYWTPGDSPLEEFIAAQNQGDCPDLDEIMSCCVYGIYARRIIYSMKLFSKPYIAKGIGKLMGERAQSSKIVYDFLVPVPMAQAKQQKRGYNQAELLARAAAKELDIPVRTDLLIKTKNTASMRGSSGEARRSLLLGAFSAINPSEIEGKNILLVDDVVTTGSTAAECAKTLKCAGSTKVGLLSFASAKRYGII